MADDPDPPGAPEPEEAPVLILHPAPELSPASLDVLRGARARMHRYRGDAAESAGALEAAKMRGLSPDGGPGSRVYGFLSGIDVYRPPPEELLQRTGQPPSDPGITPPSAHTTSFPQFRHLLPELVPLILQHCDPPTLLSLLTVSRPLSAAAHEALYRTHLAFLRSEFRHRWRRILARERHGWDVHVRGGAERIAAEIFALQEQEQEQGQAFPSPRLLALQHAYRQAWGFARRSLLVFREQAAGYAADLGKARVAADEAVKWLTGRIGERRWMLEEGGREEWRDPEPPMREDGTLADEAEGR
ncbi:hypothetical protein DFJ74DRAFT_769238 [Hyaloraphidium curvatum]|nr:hypothetical protein DFJ74DRAFT_769238 [Hyaloraphidium curvatum]